MRELLALRHGATAANELGIYTGWQDIPLSTEGKRSLAMKRFLYPPANLFFTSGMLRTRETLTALYGEVPAIELPQLREYGMGIYEGRSHDDLYSTEPLYREWVDTVPPDLVLPGGESLRHFQQRVQKGISQLIAHPWEGTAVLIVHGGTLSTLFLHWFHRYPSGPSVQNGGGWRIRLDTYGDPTTFEAFP